MTEHFLKYALISSAYKFARTSLAKISLTLIITAQVLTSCHPPQERESLLEFALESAGQNRTEFEKVLSKYSQDPKDSLKYDAAVFLIENMPFYQYREGEQLDNYHQYYRLLKENKKAKYHPDYLVDSIMSMYGPLQEWLLESKRDIEEIDSAYLVNNIEWAFKVREEQPWGKNVSFKDFCEHILPHRIGNEKLEYWREDYYNEYNHLLDSLRSSDSEDKYDPINAVREIMKYIADDKNTTFTTIAPPMPPHSIGPAAAKNMAGSCKELTDFVAYACKALGIPCGIDYLPIREDNNVGHFWITYKDKRGEVYVQDFPGEIRHSRKFRHQNPFSSPVYRITYSINQDMMYKLYEYSNEVHPIFRMPLYEDVSPLYYRHYIESFEFPDSLIYKHKFKNNVVYLCYPRHLEWTPTAWGIRKKGKVIFSDMPKHGVKRLCVYEDNKLIPISDPFRIDLYTNYITTYNTNGNKEDITLFAKFPIYFESLWRDRMLGGVFEGSNNPTFIDCDTLHIINSAPNRLMSMVDLDSKKKYRYIRYYGPDGTHCNIAEMGFYENPEDTVLLTGRIIGTAGSYTPNDPHEHTAALDGKTWTSFDYKEPDGGWVGLDLGQPKHISRLFYTPRNQDNYIKPDNTYELFYCDSEWKSAGVINSSSDSLSYSNMPVNALLYLKCHNGGIQERVFSIKGKDIWWH